MESIISEEDRKKRRKKELIQEAFQQLMEGKKQKQKQKGFEAEEEEEDLLISRLLIKLDSVERDGDSIRSFENSHEQEVPEPESKPESASVRNVRNVRKSRTEEAALNEMAKDLRRVKRQNFITHCLLSVIVVGIAVWQFNEVSFLLAVKEKFSNPLRAVGDAIKGSIKWRKKKKKQKLQIEGGVPELARGDLPKLVLNDEG
ncbi:uncharacterized protein LOC109726141 [Ananas comosus]|uniref:Uncharacterized protein LOC109726141 n=1 Tax=Ananas comosus TaxID=4615 RepID=A0A199UU37_ANACO|nr:uncharacterized protein LOC109726141 [Ananas comosus]XP_020111172.1 uncharacterized protein LOC109726141 [Ananas comosus]OAY68322.1 hypothetical protein ACMD2_12799 [Ananas comosus]